jgi:radical SAM protein with 4Fe4S-binding SPASM domain
MSEFKLYPHSVVWEITWACNMRCIHCGTSAGKRRPDELTTSEALGLIDELAALGCQSITLSGGEPLMREDWPELGRRIKERGVLLYMVTNGFSVDQNVVDTMLDMKFDRVAISFDGVEKTHNYIRQRPDAYERALNAMRLMQKSGQLDWCAISQICNINLAELDDIRNILIAEGCRTWRVQMTTNTGRMQGLADMVLSLDNYPRLIDKMIEFKRSNTITVDVGENIGYYGAKASALLDGFPYFGCYAGTRVAGIESNGNVKGCLSMPEEFVEGNIRSSSFTEIWNDPDKFSYNRRFTRDTAKGFCHQCRYLPLCRGGCATTSVSQSGCRADNPYCMYRLEVDQGITPTDSELVEKCLKQIDEAEAAYRDRCTLL